MLIGSADLTVDSLNAVIIGNLETAGAHPESPVEDPDDGSPGSREDESGFDDCFTYDSRGVYASVRMEVHRRHHLLPAE